MSFISEIRQYKSLSIVGLEKNTGKTECLNYILKRLPSDNYSVAVTSIGIDGESKDQVTGTAKPEIVIKEGTIFSTSEAYYHRRQVLSELLEITAERSSLGRIVTARALRSGKVMLGGPSSSQSLGRWVESVAKFGADLTIVDGALSRLSSASPIISESLVLTTGAAYSIDMERLVRSTKFIVELVGIDLAQNESIAAFKNLEKGVWGLDSNGNLMDFHLDSSLAVEKAKEDITEKSVALYVAGALTDRFLGVLADSKRVGEITLVVRDFTKIFVTEQLYRNFVKRGGVLRVLQKSKLVAVCVNPLSPQGVVLNSELLCKKMRGAIDVPVYDIVREADRV
ncbi:MAG: hypothetical protein IKI67_03725 [Bacteroidales bacterium]|nr:hypothetical protein [Bacteroidales bacterium]